MAELQVNSKTGVDGNTYTTSISNDQLTNEDFLNLMIQELKLQDPTSPMDSKEMLSTQMQMSTIQTNQETIAALSSLKESFNQSALSNAASVIGKSIEDGNLNENGVNKAYTVRSVENVDGEIQVRAQEILYMEDRVLLSNGDKKEVVNYNAKGEILDDNGNLTGEKIVLESVGRPLLSEGKLVLLDEENNQIQTDKYELAGITTPVYSDQISTVPFSSITRIF